MTKRIRKPPVLPERRREWLDRSERGESPPKIADNDGFDVRTVRKHIELAKLEKEAQQGRAAVVRNALERHYGDICYFAQKLDAAIAAEAPISLELRNDRMWGALKQHQPRLSLWKYLKYWDELQKQLVELRKIIKDRLQISVGADTRLEHLSSSQFEAALSGIVAAVAFNMEQQARGAKGLNLDEDLNVKPKTGDLVKIEYGSFHLGDQPKNEVGNIKSTIADWRRRVTHWKKYPDMRILLDKLLKTRDKIRDELAVIILRRIVTGHCKYCPL